MKAGPSHIEPGFATQVAGCAVVPLVANSQCECRIPGATVSGAVRYRDIICSMAQLVVRQLDDDVKEKLRHRARRHGRSTEEEVREILRNAVRSESNRRPPLGSRLAARFKRISLEEEIPELRGQPAQPAEFEP